MHDGYKSHHKSQMDAQTNATHTYQPRVPNTLTVHAIRRIVYPGLTQQLGGQGAA